MIYLVAPPEKGRLSGGFRVNEALIQRLIATDTGAGITATPSQVLAKIQALPSLPSTRIVLDSLYLISLDPHLLSHALTTPRAPISLYFLLHFLPSLNPYLESSKRAVLQERERTLLKLVEGVFVPGPTLANHLRSQTFYTGSIHLCPPGIELTQHKTLTTDPWKHEPSPRLITLGALNRPKGQREILTCLEQIVPTFTGSWHLFGDLQTDPETRRCFEAQTRASQLNQAVHLHPNTPHALISKALADADLLVSASRFESYGMAIAEAAAAGTPVLAYQVGESSQWIKNGANGLLIPVGNTTAFQSALETWLMQPAKLSQLKRQAKKIREKISFPTWDITFRYFLAGCGENLP